MSKFYDSLRNVISAEKVRIAAEVVDEKPENVKKAVDSIIPSLLGIYLKEHNPGLNNILVTAGNLDMLDCFDVAIKDEAGEEQRRVNNDFQQSLLGDKAISFATPIAEEAGISTVAANRLTSVMSALVAGYLGDKLVNEKWTESRLLTELRSTMTDYGKYIPSGILKSFNLSFPQETAKAAAKTSIPVEKKKKSYSWIWWLLLIALLILLAIYGWKSCRDDKKIEAVEHKVEQKVDQAVDKVVDAGKRLVKEIKLPDGKILTIYSDGIEEKLHNFLSSGEYEKASAEDLKYKWFNFKDVDFEFNSATKLKEGSLTELDNLAAIIKSYPSVKIMIAGFADKKGTEEVNMKISQERAKTIERLLDERGLKKQIVKTEGFGERYAKHDAKETDMQRSEDRDFALRFVK